jgi:hypothetical protein
MEESLLLYPGIIIELGVRSEVRTQSAEKSLPILILHSSYQPSSIMLFQKFGLLALGASAMASPMPSGNKNVDGTSTRSDWVTSYKPSNKNVDGTSTRSDWVTSYKPSGNKNVDATSTRSDWVTSYKPSNENVDDMRLQHWAPLGPVYLKLDYSPVHHEHLITLASGTMMMHGDGLGGFMGAVARFLHL